MSITATVEEGGRITLPGGVEWPAGSVVSVELMEPAGPTLWDGLKEFNGIASDLPSDLSANLDHYVHGHQPR